ncbi:BnaC07g06470D [Brassica napus]|uniref:BnaC07g06470D protein n=1 Tax=Brassica napus TaxID=3708 RepID=A0A078IK47_BRANA|nr:BnaC07g06470D [Brassica napus]
MVSIRLVDCSDPPKEQPVRPIPEMMFAVGEEPVGVRVLTYLSSGAINRIFNALEEEEVQVIRRSAFGKILEIVDKPFPMKSKMKLKETISEKPYWPSLFGKAEVATVASVIKLLARRSVADRAVRIKYACLAILSSVLLPTNMKMKICREHAEAIEDMDEFFSYPWGKLAFDMLMGSIKEIQLQTMKALTTALRRANAQIAALEVFRSSGSINESLKAIEDHISAHINETQKVVRNLVLYSGGGVQGIYQEKNVYYLSFLHVPHAPSLVFHFYYKWEQMKTKLSHSSDMSDTLFFFNKTFFTSEKEVINVEYRRLKKSNAEEEEELRKFSSEVQKHDSSSSFNLTTLISLYRNAVEMENITERETDRVGQDTNKEIETEEQSLDNVMETDKQIATEQQSLDNADDKNPKETIGEDDPESEHKDSPPPMPMVTEEGTNDDDPPKIDDEKNSQLEVNRHPSPPPSVEDTLEQNIASNKVSSDVLRNGRDSDMVDEDTAVVHEETTTIALSPDTKVSEEKGSPLHHADTATEQDKTAEEHDMTSSGEHKEFPVIPDTKLSVDKGSPLHLANTVTEQDKTAEELDIISSGEQKEFLVNSDTKVFEENNDKIDEGEANNMNLADDGSRPVDHDQGTTTEVEKGLEVPGSETVSKLEDKPSEPLIETTVNVEKEPDMPATENLTENDKLSDVLAAGVSGDSAQTSSDHNEVVATLEAEPIEDMEIDVPDSKLVTDAGIDSTNNNDVNVDAPNAEKKDYSIVLVPEKSDTENENASVRLEPGPPCVVSSDTKGLSGGLNNGVHKIGQPSSAPGCDGTMSAKRSFLLDDASDGNESGTEEDQSAFMKELYQLFRAVIRVGGYDKVTGCKLWRQVGESFRPPKTCTTVSWTFRGFYEKALLEYERHKVMMGELQIPLATEPEPMNIDNQASGSGRAKRDSAARAMQGWNSQRLNGNGEVNDPAVKDKNLVLHQKREKQMGNTPGVLKRKRPSSTEHAIQVSRPMLDVTVVDVGPPADWVKINVQRTAYCFEVYALVPGLVREEVRVQSDPAGRLVKSGEPENPMNTWGATPFKKVVSLPTRIDPHHTWAVVTLNGQLFVRVPLEQSD